jgi:hypothetical protein
MNLDDYPYFFLTKDGRLCPIGWHCPGFPRVLFDALLHLGYNGDAPIYPCRMSMPNGLDMCEVSVTIPFDPMEPWSRSIIGSEPGTAVKMRVDICASPPYVRVTLLLLQHCLSRFS